MYKQELKWRDTTQSFEKVSNKKTQELLDILKGPLKITDPEDELFVRRKVLEYTNKIMNAAAERASDGRTRSQHWKVDRMMRFIECMALDNVKTLYLKVNECMARYEMDVRNSDNIPKDFYDVVCEEFNDAMFIPYSRVLPGLHEDLQKPSLFPLMITSCLLSVQKR